MKNGIFPICLLIGLLNTNLATAQQEKYIDSLKIIPQLSGSNDSIKTVCFSHYQYEVCQLDTSILTIDTNKNYIMINASHYLDRDRMESCYSIDTILIGGIAAGTYT